MEIIYLSKADEDLKYWIRSGNKNVLKKIAMLTESILQSNFEGVGKPEALRYDLAGKWSRRITQKDRYVYEIIDNVLYVYSLRGHYV